MTTVTEAARDWYQERAIGETDAVIDTVAVGVGEDSEDDESEELDDEVYRNDVSVSTVSIDRTDETGEIRCRIRVTGGTEVDSDTEITEMMAYVSDDETTIAIDNFNPIRVASGQTEQFDMKVRLDRD